MAYLNVDASEHVGVPDTIINWLSDGVLLDFEIEPPRCIRTVTVSIVTATRHPCAGEHYLGPSSLVSLGSYCIPWSHMWRIWVKWVNLVWPGRMDSTLFLELLTPFNCGENLTGAPAPKGLNECTLAAYSFIPTVGISFAWQLMYCSGWYRIISLSLLFSLPSRFFICSSTSSCCHSDLACFQLWLLPVYWCSPFWASEWPWPWSPDSPGSCMCCTSDGQVNVSTLRHYLCLIVLLSFCTISPVLFLLIYIFRCSSM